MSFVKLSTVFFSILGCFFGTNVIVSKADQPLWLGPASLHPPHPGPSHPLNPSGTDPLPTVLAGGSTPLLAVGFLSAPFVATVHLRVPAAARASRTTVARWANALPRSTEVYCTTVGLIGMRKTYRTLFASLRRKRPAPFWNITNLVVTGVARERATGLVPRIRRQQGQFFVGAQRRRGFEAAVWQQVWAKIPWA